MTARKRSYKKRRYSKRRYQSRSTHDGVTELVIGLIVVAVILGGLPVMDFSFVSQALGVAVPVLLIVLGTVGIGILLLIGWKLWRVVQKINEKQERRKKINQKFEVAYANQSFMHLTPREFEIYLKNVYEQLGYRAEVTPEQHDKGVDVILRKAGEVTVVQAKRYAAGNNVGAPAVKELAGVMLQYDRGIVVSTSDFTRDAKEYATDIDRLTLINGAELRELVDSISQKPDKL